MAEVRDIERVELAIRRAASQMPGGASRTFRLLADELARFDVDNLSAKDNAALRKYREEQRDLD